MSQRRITRRLTIVAAWLVIAAVFAAGLISVADAQNPVDADTPVVNLPLVANDAAPPTPVVPNKLYGLNFSPYLDGQNPNVNPVVSAAQVEARLAIVAPYTDWIRTFGVGSGLEVTGRLARAKGLKTAIGAWLAKDAAANDAEVARLIAVANAGEADVVIVGSEVLYRGDLTAAELVGYMNQVRAAVPPTVTVTTADTFDKLLANPSVIAASDVIFGNYYPFWAGLHITQGITVTPGITVVQNVTFSQAIAALDDWYTQTVAAAGGKPVWVSETGWPTCGDTIRQAVPSPENAAISLRNFTAWAKARNVPYLYFEAFDESWKTVNEGPQGACWGVWDKGGVLKPALAPIFDGTPIADTWSGAPSIGVLHAPPYGTPINAPDRLIGHAWHVDPAQYKVAVYILVGGGWWTKPSFAEPYTPIQVDGSWSTDIATGGSDATATQIAAFLLPMDEHLPNLGGAVTLPAEADGYPRVVVERAATP